MTGVDSTSSSFQRYKDAANATANTLLQLSQGAAIALKQAIAMNMIMTSIKSGAHAVGNGALALAAYDAEQFQSYKKSGELSGAASARTIPVLVGIAIAILLFIYPVMIFLAIVAGSYRAIVVFFQILVGINLMPLLYEIINYISTFYLQKKLGIIVSGQGYTYDVSTSLYSFTDNIIVGCNWLITSTPMIAYAIVSGTSMALTSVFGHINDPAKQKAESYGDELSRGNLNLGNASFDNASYNNLNSNKLDNQLSQNIGVPILKDTSAGGIHSNIGGSNYDINYKSDLLATPNLAQMQTHTLENSLRSSQDQMRQLSKQWGSESQRVHDLSNSISSGDQHNNQSSVQETNDLKAAQDLASKINGELSINGKVFGSGVGLNYGVTSSANDSLSHDLSKYKQLSETLSHSNNQDVRDAFSNSVRLSDSTLNTTQETVAKSQALMDSQMNQSTINTNMSNDFDEYLRNNGYNPNQMNAIEQREIAQKFVDDSINQQYGFKSLLTKPTTHLNNNDVPPQLNDAGLQKPKPLDPKDDVKNAVKKIDNAIQDYVDHPLNTIGKQAGKIPVVE